MKFDKIDPKYINVEIYPKKMFPFLDKPKPKVILVMGGPGSGKGTQSKLLCGEFDIIHISIGDVLRDLRKEDTEDGKIVSFWLDEFEKTGRLMPLEVTFRILLKTFIKHGWCEKPFLVDGFIKDFSIMKRWDEYLEPILDVRLAIFYDVRLETMRKRVEKRSESESRGDEKIIERRIECFIQRTLPAVEIIKKKGYLVVINGERMMKEIQEETRVQYLKAMFASD
mmetsp:Transcript_10120/g.10443  ORF Transcript_10120/g.10443 Transcript_10120/m.10443 type:complete len:225 (+) Transcript_10120:163-837(+)